jgi:hypothetical protein
MIQLQQDNNDMHIQIRLHNFYVCTKISPRLKLHFHTTLQCKFKYFKYFFLQLTDW